MRLVLSARETREDSCQRCRDNGRVHVFEGACLKTKTDQCKREQLRAEASTLLAELPVYLRASFRLWQSCQTQLRTSFGGAIGLDYPAAFRVAGCIGVEVDEEVFEGLQAAESEQLAVWAEEDEAREKAREKR